MTAAEIAVARTPRPASLWWVALLQGVALLIVGLLLFTDPGTTLVTLVTLLGVYWLISGILDLVRMFVDHRNWGWRLLSGILGLLAGLVIIRHPLWASIVLPATVIWILGFLGIAMGVVSLVMIFRGGGWAAGIFGAIGVILGLLLLGVNPFVSVATLVLIMAWGALIGGAILVVTAFTSRLRHA